MTIADGPHRDEHAGVNVSDPSGRLAGTRQSGVELTLILPLRAKETMVGRQRPQRRPDGAGQVAVLEQDSPVLTAGAVSTGQAGSRLNAWLCAGRTARKCR